MNKNKDITAPSGEVTTLVKRVLAAIVDFWQDFKNRETEIDPKKKNNRDRFKWAIPIWQAFKKEILPLLIHFVRLLLALGLILVFTSLINRFLGAEVKLFNVIPVLYLTHFGIVMSFIKFLIGMFSSNRIDLRENY